jgi:hypothetical protein
MGFSYNVNVLNQKGSPAIYTDTFANRPTAGYVGRLFISTDTSAIYEDTGTSWTLIANVSSGAGTLEQVTTNGNTTTKGISISAGGLSTNSLTDTALTLGSVLFAGAAGLVTQDNAAFFFDDTNNRLGINTTTPTNTLDLHFAGTTAMLGLNNTAGNQSAIIFSNTGANKWRIGNTSTNNFDFYNSALALTAITINATSNVAYFNQNIFIKHGGTFYNTAGYNSIGSDINGFYFQRDANLNVAYFNFSSLTTTRNFSFPDATGTVALTSDLGNYLPLSGGTLTGTLNGTSGSFTSTLASTGTGSNTVLAGTGLRVKSSNANLYLNFSPPFTGATESEIASSDNGLRIVAASTSGSANTMRFLTSNSSGNSIERLKIDGSGNIGINGTPTSYSTNVYFDIKGNSTTQGGIFQSRNSDDSIQSSISVNTNGLSIATQTSHPILFSPAATEKMRLTVSGNLLINSTTDDTVNKLQVNGGLKASALYMTPTIGTAAIVSASINFSTLFPYLTFNGNTIGLTITFTLVNGGSQLTTCLVNCCRTSATTWTYTIFNNNSIGVLIVPVLTFGGTTAAPTLTVTGATYVSGIYQMQII